MHRLIGLFAAAMLAAGCTPLTLSWADLDPDGAAASPLALGAFGDAGPVEDAPHWAARRAALLDAFQRHVYGVLPDASATQILDRKTLNAEAFEGAGLLEEYRLEATATFNGVAVATPAPADGAGFYMEVLTPDGEGPFPVILMETFCPRWEVIPDPAVSKPGDPRGIGGFADNVATYVFGRYICTPPIADILAAGYAIASVYPHEFIPDREREGLAELRRLSAGHQEEETRWGAVAAWAWVYARMIDVLENDPRYDGFIAWGHSRYAKSALLAAAFDGRIDAVIAHQSGTGGASLNRDKPGESLASITRSYPHWFSRRYARYAGREDEMPIDQHLLLALIAPRPVLLGNARRDVWSDPAGAFTAAEGADPVYELLGAEGLTAERLDRFDPQAELSFWIRPGTHGVVKEDWPAFLRFLDAQLKQGG